MSVIIKCQHSGIEFEAASRRTKQHPAVAELKNRANKDGTYRQMNEALDAVRKEGGYETIDEYINLVKQQMNGVESYKARQLRFRAEREAARDEIRQRRQKQNAILREHGYTWHAEYVDRDAPALEMRDEGKYFYLTAPDGRIVTVEQAMAEIELGAEIVQAWDAAIAEDKRREEAKRQAEQKQAAQDYDASESEAIKDMVRVERFEHRDFEQIASYRRSPITAFMVSAGEINGVRCAVVSQWGDMDYSWYYCADPQAAGLTVKEAKHSSFGDYF